MSIEQLRREVEIAIGERNKWQFNTSPYDEREARVRAAFDAYDKALLAANKPTFEGDEAPMINEQEVRHLLRSSGTELDRQALALLDAKDERLASAAKWNDLYANARDEALARAERAEQALADRDAVIVGLMDCLIETVGTPRVEALHGKRLDAAYDAAKTFLPAPEPVKVDPLVEALRGAIGGLFTPGWLEERAANLRAAIERAGGVKAVFGEGA